MADDHSPNAPPKFGNIEISLTKLAQLFNSLDPSPFHERDLDDDAADYIVGSAEEAPHSHPSALVIILPPDQLSEARAVPEAIHNYFAYRELQERRRLRTLYRDGRFTLVTGLAFLFCCVGIRELVFSFGSGTASQILGEGALILGWVAMWRPLETFLYDWVPIRRRCQLYALLAKLPVFLRAK